MRKALIGTTHYILSGSGHGICGGRGGGMKPSVDRNKSAYRILVRKLNERDSWQYLGIDGTIILTWKLKKWHRSVDWMYVALGNMVINIRIPSKAKNLFTGWASLGSQINIINKGKKTVSHNPTLKKLLNVEMCYMFRSCVIIIRYSYFRYLLRKSCIK